jgi:hypothetical protein
MREKQRRESPIIDRNIDLPTAIAVSIDDEGTRSAVTGGQIAVEEVDPMVLGGGSADCRVLEQFSDRQTGQHLVLDVKEHFTKIDFAAVLFARHTVPRIRAGLSARRAGISKLLSLKAK